MEKPQKFSKPPSPYVETSKHQLSNEKKPGCLVYIWDEILPTYMGTIINHEIRIPVNNGINYLLTG